MFEHDIVLDLPNWKEPLPSKIFSGFLDAGVKDGKKVSIHYVLVESERDPQTDPVVLWLNGGPGASSLFGLFVELGPLRLQDGTATLVRNEFAWTKRASVLFLNSPAPVGFSYCEEPNGDFRSCGAWNDSSVAFHNKQALDSFLVKHPKFKQNDWIFAGESYGGVYVPTLVREIISTGSPKMKVRGMVIGNGCMGTDVLCLADGDYWWRILALYGHAQISQAAFEQFDVDCGKTLRRGVATQKCKEHAAALEKQVGYFDEYNVYSECWYAPDFKKVKLDVSPPAVCINKFCGGDIEVKHYVDIPEVRKALNIPNNAMFWSSDNGEGFDYDFTERDLRPFYVQLAKHHPYIRVLIYSGDVDISVSVFAAQNWTRNLGLEETEAWRPWTLDGGREIAGYVTRYEGDFDFTTIRGSGHFVPQYKSRAALEMLTQFLARNPLKRYNPKAKLPGSEFPKIHSDQKNVYNGNEDVTSIIFVVTCLIIFFAFLGFWWRHKRTYYTQVE